MNLSVRYERRKIGMSYHDVAWSAWARLGWARHGIAIQGNDSLGQDVKLPVGPTFFALVFC